MNTQQDPFLLNIMETIEGENDNLKYFPNLKHSVFNCDNICHFLGSYMFKKSTELSKDERYSDSSCSLPCCSCGEPSLLSSSTLYDTTALHHLDSEDGDLKEWDY